MQGAAHEPLGCAVLRLQVGEMLSDVNLGIRWVLDNIQQYGGDPTRVHLVGQSAGGHLAAMALLLQAAAAQHDSRHAPLAPQQQHSTQHRQQQRSEAEEAEQAVADLAAVLQTHARWHPHELAGFVGVSGVYDILGLQTHFGSLGLGPGVVDRLFSVKGRPSMQLLSPLHCLLPLAEVASSAGGGGTEQVRDADSSSQLAGSADCSGNSCSRLSDDDVMQQDCSTGSTSSSHSSSQRAEDLAVSTSCQLAITSPSVHHRHGHALHPHKDQRSAARPCAKPALQHRRQQHQHHLLPAITLLHGAQDRTVPCHVSEAFACALRRAGAALSVHLRVYGSETHTSPLVENPMRGGRDELTDAILAAVVGQGASSGHARLCPERLIRLAAAVCPF
jgi:acetyl esterase/lipase